MTFDKSVNQKDLTINFKSGIKDIWNIPLKTTSLKIQLDNEVKPEK